MKTVGPQMHVGCISTLESVFMSSGRSLKLEYVLLSRVPVEGHLVESSQLTLKKQNKTKQEPGFHLVAKAGFEIAIYTPGWPQTCESTPDLFIWDYSCEPVCLAFMFLFLLLCICVNVCMYKYPCVCVCVCSTLCMYVCMDTCESRDRGRY